MSKVVFKTLAERNDESSIVSAINSLHRRSDSLQLDIHLVLTAIATRWAASGDMRPVSTHINLLLTKDKMGGVRKNAIKAWVQKHMGLAIIEEGDNKGHFYVPVDLKDGKHLKLKELCNERWWEMKPEEDYKPIEDPIKLIKALTNKLIKDQNKAGDQTKVTPEMIEALNAMTATEVLH